MTVKTSNTAGFTFVETIITIGVIGVLLALTWATINFMLIKSNDQIVRTRAHFLAMEGVEIVKQIRQTGVNRNRETGFEGSIGKKNGLFVIGRQGDAFTLEEGENEVIEMTEEPFTSYCRTLQITGNSELLKEVVSIVKWGAPDCAEGDQVIRLSTYLADLTQ